MPSLKSGKWQLLHRDLSTVLRHAPTMPLTTLQKRWLKAISEDPRIRLFHIRLPDLDGVEPLFTQKDYRIYDKYADGDPFESDAYIPLQLALGDAALHGAFQNLGYRIVINGIQFAEYYSFSPPPMPYRSYIACKSALNLFSALLLEKRIEVILDRKVLIQGSISFVSKTSAEKR